MKKLTVEEFLKPRYKVIADILGVSDKHWKVGTVHDGEEACIAYIGKFKFVEYPHLFKKLEWWEERQPGEFPDYMKVPESDDFFPVQWGIVFKVQRWGSGYFNTEEGLSLDNRDWVYQPATEEEYNAYKSKEI